MFLSNCLLAPAQAGAVLGNAACALAGEITDHPAPDLVAVVKLIDDGQVRLPTVREARDQIVALKDGVDWQASQLSFSTSRAPSC
jgi:hypothetical protein